MEEITREEFYRLIDLNQSAEIHNDINVSIFKYKGKVYKTAQIGNHYCETSIDCTKVIDGKEDTKFYIES